MLSYRANRESASWLRRLGFRSVGFVIFAAAWFGLSSLHVFPRIFFPTPLEVLRALWQAARSGDLLLDVGASLFRVLAGYVCGLSIAVPVGIFMAYTGWVGTSLGPLTEFFRYLPVPALLPLCILWFGIGELEKVAVIFLGTFFQLVVLVSISACAVPNEFIDVGYSLGMDRTQIMWRIVFRYVLPRMFEDFRVSLGWAWSYVVVAEIVASAHGIGFMIIQNQRYLHTADVIAAVLVVGILGLISDWAFRAAAIRLFPYESASTA